MTQFLKYDSGKSRIDLLPLSARHFMTSKQDYFKLYFWALQKDSKADLINLGTRLLKITGLFEVGLVLAFGANKYEAENWRNVDDLARYWSALGRHLLEVDKNPKAKDKETKLLHASHALTNILFLVELMDQKEVHNKEVFKELSNAN